MSATNFDTLTYAKMLQEAGFTAQQAEAWVEAVVAVVEGNLATKQDIGLVRQDTREMETRLPSIKEFVREPMVWLSAITVAGFMLLAAMIGAVIALVAM